MLMFLFSAIAVGAALVVRVEVKVAERFRQSAEALYAAEAALDVSLSELRTMPTWTPVFEGGRRSSFSDGAFMGAKTVPGGGAVNVCCGVGSASDRLASDTRTSPVPARRALVWRPFLWTPFDVLAPGDPPSRLYVIVSVANDEEAGEGGADTILVRAEALAPDGLHRTIESLVVRRHPTGSDDVPDEEGELKRSMALAPGVLGVLAWREVR
jgi:hypothetical protein